MLMSREGSLCQKALVQCPHCKKHWPSLDSLEAHLRCDIKCKRAENIPYTISVVSTKGNATSDTPTKEHIHEKCMKGIKVTHHGKAQDTETVRESNMFIKKKSGDGIEGVLKLRKQDFRAALKNPDLEIIIDIDKLLEQENLSEVDLLISALLSKTKLCGKQGTVTLKDSLVPLLFEVQSARSWAVLNGDYEYLPGAKALKRDINNDDLCQYALKHGEIIKTMPPSQQSQSTAADESSIANGSMVFDFEEVNYPSVDSHSDDQSTSSRSDAATSVTSDYSNFDGELVDKSMLELQEQVLSVRESGVYDNSDAASVALFQLLKNASAPKYLFDKILGWAHENSFELACMNSIPRRKTFVKEMAMKTYGKNLRQCFEPERTLVVLPSGKEISVTTFSLRASIASLLMDSSLMNSSNLLLHPDNPFEIGNHGNVLSELNTGWWYKETVDEVCSADNHILLPIVLFIDGATIDKMGKLQVEPISFSLGIFNRETRKNAKAWRTLGYIEDYKNATNVNLEQNSNKVSSTTKLQDYHAIINHIIKDIYELQGKDGGFQWKLGLGDNTEEYNVIFKIATQVVIGDCKGNDLLCGRYGSHSKQVKRLCRDCKVLTVEGDDPMHVCKWIKRADIESASKEELQSLSFHQIENAFTGVYFGARNLGITQCTPPEPLHGFKLGLCKYLFEALRLEVPPRTLRLMNTTIGIIIRDSSAQSERNLPDLSSFRNGLDVTHTLTAKETYARIFGVYLTLMDPKVFESFATQDRYFKEKDPEQDKLRITSRGPLGRDDALNWFHLIEDTVLFDGWLMQPSHTKASVTACVPDTLPDNFVLDTSHDAPAQIRIRKYLSLFKLLVQRSHGNGLKFPKFHQNLHYCEQILKDGSLLNIDGGRPESLNKQNIKDPAKITQKTQSSISWQLAKNYHEDLVLKATTSYFEWLGGKPMSEVSAVERSGLGGSKFELSFLCEDYNVPDSFELQIKWKGKEVKESVNSYLCQCISKRLFLHTGEGGCLHKDSIVNGFTEFTNNGVTYRAHPSYRGTRPWFDWALFNWEGTDELIPAKIIMFVDISECQIMTADEHQAFCRIFDHNNDLRGEVDHGYYYLTNEKWVIIHSCLQDDEAPEGYEGNLRFKIDSCLSKRYFLEENMRILPVSAIVEPTYSVLVPSTSKGNPEEVFTVLPKDKWGGLFLPGY